MDKHVYAQDVCSVRCAHWFIVSCMCVCVFVCDQCVRVCVRVYLRVCVGSYLPVCVYFYRGRCRCIDRCPSRTESAVDGSTKNGVAANQFPGLNGARSSIRRNLGR